MMALARHAWYCPHCGATVLVEERTPGYWQREAARVGLPLTAAGVPVCHGTAMVDSADSADLPPTHWYPEQGTGWTAAHRWGVEN